MRFRQSLWLAAGLLAAGCDGVTTVSELPATVTLEVGEEARLPEHGLRLVLEEVVEDSRCPEDAICVWQGRVVVRFRVVHPNAQESEVVVNTEQPSVFAGLRLLIAAVSPRRLTQTPIGQDDYRISLEIRFAAPPP
ncbi:MAG: hypothetical protein ACT4PM_15120 [Gemmatimonadales bacterium]